MNCVIMYQPICRELLEDLFQSAFVAQSFREVGYGAYAIQLPDRDIPRLARFGVSHSIVKYRDLTEVKAKQMKYEVSVF